MLLIPLGELFSTRPRSPQLPRQPESLCRRGGRGEGEKAKEETLGGGARIAHQRRAASRAGSGGSASARTRWLSVATSVGRHRQELTWQPPCHLVLSPVPGLPQRARATSFLIFVFASRA